MKVFSFKGGDFWRVADGSGLFVTVCMVTLFTHLEKPLEWVVKFDEMRFRVYGNYPHSNKLGLQDRTTKRRNQQEVNGEFSSSNSLERGNFQRQGADNQKIYGNTQAHLENPRHHSEHSAEILEEAAKPPMNGTPTPRKGRKCIWF